MSLSFLVLFVAFNLQFAILFLRKWLKSPFRSISDSRFLWAILLIAFAAQEFFFLISDFIIATTNAFSIFIIAGYISVAIGIIIFIYIQENVLPMNTHRILTVISAVSLAVLMVLPRDLQMYLAVALVIFFGGVFALFSRYILRVTTGRDKKLFFTFILGIVFIALGELLTAQLAYQINVITYPIGAFFLFLGSLAANYSLFELPSFLELDWLRQIQAIYVSFISGIPIIHAKVENGKIKRLEETDETMITTGILSALKSALKRVTESKQITSFVDQGDVKIIFGTNEQLLVAVVTTRNTPIIHEKIVAFLNQVNLLFGKRLEKWGGDPTQLEPIYDLLVGVFTE